MSLAVAIQMDPLDSINIDADSTFVLALAAQARGHRLYHYLPRHLSLKNARVQARARLLEVRRTRGSHFTLGEEIALDLALVDVVLMRATYNWTVVTPVLSWFMVNMANNQHLLSATTAFRNEPYTSNVQGC